MTLWDGLARATAEALAANLSDEQRQRGTALLVARAAKPDSDASDLMIMANYVITGLEIIPEPRDDPYPHASGDFTVLGPEIFTNTTIPAENTWITWKGENFVPQRDKPEPEPGPADHAEVLAHTDEEHPDDPGPELPADEDPLEVEATLEPAPMAGTHWQGRRGGKSS